MMFILCLLIFLPKIICGFALIHWFWKDLDFSTFLLKIGVGVPLGLATSSSLFFISVLVGVSPKIYSLTEFWGFLVVSLLFVLRLLPQINMYWKFPSFSRQDYSSAVILISGLGLLTYAFLLYSRLHPYGFEDAWSIWNYTARFLYRTNSPAIFFDNQFYDPFHPDYPVGLGLNVAWGWFVLGRESIYIPVAIAFYVIVTPALILWAALKKWRGTLPAMLATLVYLMNPNLKWSVGQMADGFVALYMVAAIAMLYGYLRSSNPRLLLIAGLLAGFSAWIKNEGILFLCVFLFMFAIMLWKGILTRREIVWLVMGIVPPVLVVATYKVAVETPSEFFNGKDSFMAQILDFQRWVAISKEFSVNILNYGNWPLSTVLVLVIYIILVGLDHSERHRQIWLGLIILAQFAGYFIIYLITPYDLDWHLSTSIDRVISHLFPMALFWMFTAVQPPHTVSSTQVAQRAGT